MRSLYKLLLLNLIVMLFVLYSYFNSNYSVYLFLLIGAITVLNIYIVYKKSNNLDKQENKKKIMLHQIKNSLSVILGYNDAFNDNLISKDEFEKNIKEEIDTIVKTIRDELYR